MAIENAAANGLLKEISDWKLEARLEDNGRYFYHLKEAAIIENGKKSFVIGRKGSGKTAIAEYIRGLTNHDVFVEKLTFKNFPFNELYEQTNQKFTRPNQYITLWKYLIYSVICKMMATNAALAPNVTTVLSKVFSPDPVDSLERSVRKWVATDFNILTPLGGASLKKERKTSSDSSLADRVLLLEEIIATHADQARYFVVFDELDEDYKDTVERAQKNSYIDLLTSLFKAVQDVRAIFSSSHKSLMPIVFLRDDIYGLIQDSDKNKWSDLRVNIDWDESKIQSLLAFRISRALNREESVSSFSTAWQMLMRDPHVGIGTKRRRKIPTFKFITRSTLLRPRDYIRYLQIAAERQIEVGGGGKIGSGTLWAVDKAFSNYLRDELVDEIHGILPDIPQILEIFSQLRKQYLTMGQFKGAFDHQVSARQLQTRDIEFVLQILFHFSVIGNQSRKLDHPIFRYENRDARFNYSENIVVHRGLFKALQIV